LYEKALKSIVIIRRSRTSIDTIVQWTDQDPSVQIESS